MFSQLLLNKLYLDKKLSSSQISKRLKCSEHKVNYWLEKFSIKKRSISEAIYIRANPKGDPFLFRNPDSDSIWFLYGLGIGLYWGEGTKRSKHSVRLGNSDPMLIKKFMEFLYKLYGINKNQLAFGLQIFGDMDSQETLKFWCQKLNIRKSQFYKLVITPYRGVGNYRQKTKYGVLTVHFHNKKLRDII